MTAEDKIKLDLIDYINKMEIDVDCLGSYQYHSAVNSWSSCYPEPESEDWDRDEEFQAKIQLLINDVENFGHLGDYVDMTDEEVEDDELQLRLLNWLKSLVD